MKRAESLLLFGLLATLPAHAFVIETAEGRKEREACIARIEAVFDFKVVDDSIRRLVADLKEVDGVALKPAILGDTWTAQDRRFRSGSWWLSYEGGATCSFAIYFMGDTKVLDAEGDTALHFSFELVTADDGPKRGSLIGLKFKGHSVSHDHIWISP